MKNIHVSDKFRLARRRQAIALFAGWMMLGCGAAWAQAQTGNATITVTGSILGPTCSLQTSNITIPLGTVDKSVFTGVGSASSWGPNVALVSAGCNASLVSMTFTGTANTSNPDLFAVAGGAAGVGIQLARSNSTTYAVPNSTTTPITFTPAAAGGGYSFSARYMQTDATITPGVANATIIVLITYT